MSSTIYKGKRTNENGIREEMTIKVIEKNK